jgi:hypothetical protein
MGVGNWSDRRARLDEASAVHESVDISMFVEPIRASEIGATA